MVSDRLQRRTFLSGITATMGSIAGCGQDPESGQSKAVTTNNGESTSNTDRNRGTSNGETDGEFDSGNIPTHDHSSDSAGGAILRPEAVSIGEFQQAPSYIVYHRDGKLRALNGRTNEEEFTGTDASPFLQNLIDELSSGTIFVKSGVYEVGPEEIFFQSNIRLLGEGPGATIFRLKDGINGRRGELRSTVFVIGETVRNVSIENLEIDGNESGNREVPGYPQSPHHHGISIHGDDAQVPETRKAANVTLKNLYIHDTVRSNIVLAGRNCELLNLRLANSATDHWLYMAGASNCNVNNIHASGFARTEGIVFGVGKRRCFGNTLTNVTISGLKETPYQNIEPEGVKGRYPTTAVIFRHSSGFAENNTIRDIRIRIPEAEYGMSFDVFEPETTIENLSYQGPMPVEDEPFIWIDDTGERTSITNSTIEYTDSGTGKSRAVCTSHAPDITFKDLRIETPDDGDTAGFYFLEAPRPVARNIIRDTTVSTSGPVIRVNRGDYGVPNLFVENLQDVNNRGTEGVDRINPIQMGIYS